MSAVLADFRFALRTMARSPMFTAVAVFSLALGIGANTAIFTLIDQLLLRLLPVKDPQQLVMIWSSGPHLGNNNGGRASSYPMYQQYQRRAPFLSHVFARYQSQASVSFAGQTERISLELISGNYFQALGVGPAAGRVFTPEEDDRTYQGHPVAVLSLRLLDDPLQRQARRARHQDSGEQLSHDRRRRFRARLPRARSGLLAASPRPHSDEAAHDARVG
jgi:hypothetical protein